MRLVIHKKRCSHALEQTNAPGVGVICASSALLFLLAKLQPSTCFPTRLSLIHPAASLYLCPASCFQEIMFKQTRTCHWNQLDFSDMSASWAHESTSRFTNTGGIRLSYVYFWSDATLLTLTSWDFSNISSQISALWAHGSTSLDVNKVNGMLAGNAKRIFCDNVTCFGTNKAARIGVI